MRKVLVASIMCNVILLILYGMTAQSNSLNYNESKRIDQVRMEDSRILEAMLVGRISKEETITIFKKHLKESDWFDKPSENGIGAGTMFFVYDKNSMLSKIEVHSFDGP